MSKLSKTARASMGVVGTQKKVVPDDQLVKMYRDNRAAKLWPALEQSDAVLRTLDTVSDWLKAAQEEVEKLKAITADELVADNEPVGGTAIAPLSSTGQVVSVAGA